MFSRSRFSLSTTAITWIFCLLTLGPFLIYPVWRVLIGALVQDGQFSPSLLLLPVRDALAREAMLNSFKIACGATALASLIAVLPAYFAARFRFAGKSALTSLLLIPLLLPPLVGAVGLRQLLGREGFLNIALAKLHFISEPVDWLQMQAPMVVLVAALHLYPLIYLNLSAAWANLDPTLEEAAENLGASGWKLWRSVTLPLLLPGYGAGALIVFIFAFTDLGTPLVFGLREVTAVQIFDAKADVTNPLGYVLGFWLTVMAALAFLLSRRIFSSGRIATVSRATSAAREIEPAPFLRVLIYAVLGTVILLAMLPHLGIIAASFARDWTSRLLPEWTTENYTRLFSDSSVSALSSIKISLLCAALSMLLDVLGGFFLAYALVRGRVLGAAILDTLAMLPLALPGLILAFGLLTGYINTPLDATIAPLPLLIIAYAVRRLPYALRAVAGGLQQTGVALEEASLNLGASPLRTMWNITRPLVSANLMAAALLTFAFAVLEVSDSLVLATTNDVTPIAKAIYQLALMPSGGTYLACALGVLSMLLLGATFFLANKLIGKQMGALFRAG